jgi:hypothetical protein
MLSQDFAQQGLNQLFIVMNSFFVFVKTGIEVSLMPFSHEQKRLILGQLLDFFGNGQVLL